MSDVLHGSVSYLLIGLLITGCVRAVGKELYNVDITSEVLDVSTETMADITQEHVTFKLQIFPLNTDGTVVPVYKKNNSQVQTLSISLAGCHGTIIIYMI